jgi:hypothetical protein
MSNMDDQWNLKSELDRKAFETVEWLFTSLDRGKITPAQFSTGIDTLFMAVNGLCAESTADLMTAADGEARKEVATLRHCMLKDDKVVALTWTVGSEQVEIVGYTAGVESTRQTKLYDTAKLACAALKKAADKLAAFGYTKL